MFRSKSKLSILSLLLITTLLLVACQQATPAAPAAPEAANDLLADVKARGVLRVSTDPNYAPQSFLNESGEYEGFDIDVAREIANRLGVEVEFVAPDWDAITAGSWGDRWDLSVGSMTITNDRAQVLNFSEGYYFTPAQFAAREGSGIETVEDIAGKTVCVGVATTYETFLNGDDLGIPPGDIYMTPPADVTVVSLSTDQECAQAIQAGRTDFDVYLTSRTVVESNIANGVPVVMVGDTVFLEKLAAATDKSASLDSTSLTQEVSNVIRAMHADGFLRTASLQWFEQDLTQR